MRKRLFFALIALLLVGMFLEVFARLVGPGIMPANPETAEDRHLPADPLVGWRTERGVQQDFGVPTPTYVNAYGVRGPELEEEKSPGEKRVLLLGDSTVYGVRVSDEESFAGRLQRRLRDHGINSNVLNAGCPGYSSWQALQVLRERLFDLEPDIVVIATLWSDAQGADSPDSARYGNGEKRSWLTHSAFYVWIRESLRKARWQSEESESIAFQFDSPGLQSMGAPPPPPQGLTGPHKLAPTHRVPLSQYRRNLRAMAREVREKGAQPVFLILPCYRDLLIGRVGDFRDAYREAMAEIAHSLDVPLINSANQFTEGDTHALFFDDVHPKAAGHNRITDALFEPILEQSRL